VDSCLVVYCVCLSFEKLVQNSSEVTLRYQILKYDLALNICSCMNGIGCASILIAKAQVALFWKALV
jgi:hypothetical protein